MATSVIGRSLRVAAVLGGVVLAAWLWHAGRGRQAQAPAESDALAAAQRLAAWLREKSAALEARAATLSELPRLAAAVATDAETVRDLTRDELGFATGAHETVELAQLSPAGATTLLRLPESSAFRADFGALLTGVRDEAAKPVPDDGADGVDVKLAVDGAWLVMTRARAIVPRDRRDVIGAIAVSWRFPAEEIASSRVDAGTLVIGGRSLVIGAGAPTAGRTVNVVLPGVPSAAALETALGPAAAPPDWSVRALGAGAGTALVLLALVWPRRRGAAASPSRAMSIPVRAITGADAAPGRVGRYEPVALMRADDEARVYVARATGEAGFERRVTLAVFETRDEHLLEALVADARRAARVQHPNLLEVLDIGGAHDACFVASEYIDGGDLALLLAHLRSIDRRVPVGIAIAIARRMCDGLAAAHAATDGAGAPLGLVHGGLAPAHVTISRTGSVKVGDFGLARARLEVDLGDVRIDVLGVGAVLYELLAGTAPQDEPASLAQVRGDVPPELEAAVRRALARDPRDRQRDCVTLEAELAAIARGGLDAGDKQIAQWLATEVQTWSPTLRGWQAAPDPARWPPPTKPDPRLAPSAPEAVRSSARALPFATPPAQDLRASGLRGPSREQQRTVNVRPMARASTPPPNIVAAPESGEYTTVAEWSEAAEVRRPRASSPRFYEVSGPLSGPHARATADGTATSLPAAQPNKAWVPVPETQTSVAVDPDERRTQAVDQHRPDDDHTPTDR